MLHQGRHRNPPLSFSVHYDTCCPSRRHIFPTGDNCGAPPTPVRTMGGARPPGNFVGSSLALLSTVEAILMNGLKTPLGRRVLDALTPAHRSGARGIWNGVDRGGLGFSDRSESGMTAIFFNDSRSIPDETTETQSLTGL